MATEDRRWNLNTYYHGRILDAVPTHAATALDVGSGDGLLSFDLADAGLEVLGIDPDAQSVERARADERATSRTAFVCADVFTHELKPHSFDVVAANAMLHHVDARQGLRRLRELVAPGGLVAIVGFGKLSGPRDLAFAVAGRAVKTAQRVRGRHWEHHAPICWPPPLSIDEMAELAEEELPGTVFARGLSGRYSVIWQAG